MQDPHVMHVHPFMFPLTRDSDSWKLHWFRDGTAVGHVISVLEALGFARAADLINRADAEWPACLLSDGAPQHMLLTGTRLPLSDGELRKLIERSGCPIENAILNRLLAYIAYLERGRVVLTRKMSAALERRNRTDIEYPQYSRGCRYFRDAYAETDDERRRVENTSPLRTYGYVVRDQLWVGGPHFASFWGMDGETTLAFAYLLRTRHANLLDGRGLSIVELKGMIPPNASSLAFVDEWETKVILDRAATTVPPPSSREQACREAPLCGPDYLHAFAGRFGLGPSLSPEPS